MKRGEVYRVKESESNKPQGAEQKKSGRPWVVVGTDSLNRARKTIICVPLATNAPETPFSPKVDNDGYLAVAVCDQIRAITKENFVHPRMSALSDYDMGQIENSLRKALML